MAAPVNLDKISEEQAMAGKMNESATVTEEENQDVVGETIMPTKESKRRKGQGRKVSVFTRDVRAKHHERATFTLVHIDQPVANRVTFALSQSESSEQSGRRVSGQEHVHRPHLNMTYQIGPRKEFSAYQVRKIIQETFESTFNDDHIILSRSALCKSLTEAIKMKTRRMNYDRYRLIVHVYLCSKDNVTLSITSRCVWDDKVDNYADYQLEMKDFYVMGIVYGIYKE